MKKSFNLFIVAVLIATALEAQSTFATKIESLTSLQSDKELVCNYTSRYIVSYQHSTNVSGVRHYFIVHDTQNGTVARFPMSADYDPYGISLHPTTYYINDMKVSSDGVCWFCGRKEVLSSTGTFIPGIGWGTQIDNYGFVGKFSLTDVLAGNGSYNLFTLTTTQELTRIEPRGNYQQVFMVGYPHNCTVDADGNPIESCLVGLGYDYSTNEWKHDVVVPVDTTEMFSDLVNTGDGIVVASRFVGDHYTIGLRHTKNGPLRDITYLSWLSSSNKYLTNTAYIFSTGKTVSWRRDTDPLFLSSDGNGGGLALTHSCDDSTAIHLFPTLPTPPGLVSYKLYVNNPGNVSITDAYFINTLNYIALKDASAANSGQKTELLVDDSANSRWTIYTFPWNNPPSSGNIKCFVDKSSYSWQGIAHMGYNPEYTYIGGHNPLGRYSYSAFGSIPPTSIQCFEKDAFSIINFSTPLATSGNGLSLTTSEVGEKIVPSSHTFTSTFHSFQTDCIRY